MRNGSPIRGFESRKALALLCLLATRGAPIPRHELVSYFWEDRPEALGRANLSRVLHNNRALLPGAFRADRHAVQFSLPRDCYLDVAEFDSLVGRGDPASLRAAVELYRGDLMHDLAPDDCPRFETWLAGEQERWRSRVIGALRRLLEAARQETRYPQAIGYAQRILEIDPWREVVHAELMLLYALAGERAASLVQYEKCRAILHDELGVEPSEETTALYARVRTGALSSRVLGRRGVSSPRFGGAPPRRTPPPGGEGDCGGAPRPEAGDIESVHLRLAHPLCRVLSVVGPAGAGATALVSRVAEAAHRTFPHGVHFIPLGQDQSESDVALAIAHALGLPDPGTHDVGRHLTRVLQEQDVLLVLDGVRYEGGAAGFLADFLRYTPWLKVLVTTDRPLDLPGEWVFALSDSE